MTDGRQRLWVRERGRPGVTRAAATSAAAALLGQQLLLSARVVLLVLSPVATVSAQQLPFNILPANRAAPAARWAGTATWGIAVGKEGGVYHAFVNTVANNCSLASWTPNSKIVRATSTSALGPFEPQETVLEAFHGNPQLTRAPDGMWLLFTDGIGSLRAPTERMPRPWPRAAACQHCEHDGAAQREVAARPMGACARHGWRGIHPTRLDKPNATHHAKW